MLRLKPVHNVDDLCATDNARRVSSSTALFAPMNDSIPFIVTDREFLPEIAGFAEQKTDR